MRAKANFTINKHHNYYKDFVIGTGVFLISFFIAGVLAPVESSDALTCTSGDTGTEGEICSTAGTDVSVTIEKTVYSISVTSSHGSSDTPVSMSYTEDSGNKLGDVVVASDTITTTSNSPLDHYLYISTNSSSNKLTNEDSIDSNPKTYIAPGGGDDLVSATTLSNDTWGFALPSTTSGIPTNSFDDSYTNDSISSSSKFTKVPVLDNDILVQKEVGTVDEDTGLNTSIANVYYGTKATSNLYAGTYANTIKYTVYTEVPSDTKTIEDIEYMQDISKEICDATDEGVTTTLLDRRGNYSGGSENSGYGVIKAKDGNCWMTDNLNLYDMTITSDNSDFPANADGTTATYKLPESTNWTDSSPTVARVHRATTSGYTDQVYYNWCSATALTSSDCQTASQVDQSICPKNWQLPVNGNSSTNKSYAKLINDYSVSTSPGLVNADLGFNYSGWWVAQGFEASRGSEGVFWESTPANATYSYTLYLSNSGTLSFNQYGKSTYGFSVRCVSRD